MFIICSVIYVVGGTIDMICLTAETQPWAKATPGHSVEDDSEKSESKCAPQRIEISNELKTAF